MRKIHFNSNWTNKFFFFANSFADELINENETELNFFTGMFDFSDHKQASGIIGLQHQNDELFRKSFLGNLSPISGGFLTEKNAFYIYYRCSSKI